jgi:hypothetical protein
MGRSLRNNIRTPSRYQTEGVSPIRARSEVILDESKSVAPPLDDQVNVPQDDVDSSSIRGGIHAPMFSQTLRDIQADITEEPGLQPPSTPLRPSRVADVPVQAGQSRVYVNVSVPII